MGIFTTEAGLDERLHRLAAEGTPDLHTVVSVDGVFRFVSAAGVAPFGWAPGDLVSRPEASFTHPDDEGLVIDTHLGLLGDGTRSVTTVCRFRCRDGSRWTESRSLVDDSGDERVVVSAVRDIAERRRFELDLQRQAATDPLTGSPTAPCSWTASATHCAASIATTGSSPSCSWTSTASSSSTTRSVTTSVAEGVETKAQHDHLIAVGCDRAQGFYFASASPPDVIEALGFGESRAPLSGNGQRAGAIDATANKAATDDR